MGMIDTKNKLFFLSIFSLVLLGGCVGNFSPKGESFPAMFERDIKRVVIMPITLGEDSGAISNIDPQLQLAILDTATKYFDFLGYEYIPIETMLQKLQENNINIQDKEPVSLEKIRSLFNADAIFYATINKWDKSYYVIRSNFSVDMDSRLLDLKNGDLIWNYHYIAKKDTSTHSERTLPVENLLGPAYLMLQNIELLYEITGTTVNRFKNRNEEFEKLTRMCLGASLRTMPFGPNNKQYKEDINTKIVIY